MPQLGLTTAILFLPLAVALGQPTSTVATAPPQQNPPASALPSVSVSPLTVKPGDTTKLIVSTDKCPGLPENRDWLDKDSVSISGNDVTAVFQQKDNCSVSYNLTIAAKPFNRQLILTITGVKPGSGLSDRISLGSFPLTIMDAPAIAPGPIPPGLTPQVDVMWDVMSEGTCKDQFGVRLSKYYFCIDVTVGNNSGYPLIVAAVGFLRHVNGQTFRDSTGSYLAARAMIQHGQVISARNITLRVLQAAGVLIAGFAPFSGNAGRRGRIAIWSTLFGSVASSVWESAVPDRTVREQANLDDAALRDGRLIPNNSPVRFAVFVERAAIQPLLLRSAADLRNDAKYSQTRAEVLRKAAAAEADKTRRAQLESEAAQWSDWAREAEIEAAQREFEEQVSPQTDPTRLDRGSKINPLRRAKAPLESDSIAVRRALGNLIIVGDQIEYLQRVQIDSSAVVPTREPAPAVDSSTPKTVEQGKAVDVVLNGRGLAKATVKAQACSPDFTVVLDPTGNSLTLKGFKVSGCAELAIPLMVDSGAAGTYLFNLPVTPAPEIDPPKLQIVLDANNTAAFALTGKNLTGATASVKLLSGTNTTSPTTKITLTDATHLSFTVDVPADYAKTGTKATVTVSTPGGGSAKPLDFTLALMLDNPPKQPAVKLQNNKVDILLTGNALSNPKEAAVVLTAPGVTDPLTVPKANISIKADPKTPDTALTVTVDKIDDKYAKAGTKATVSVTTAAGKSNSVEVTFQ